VGGNNILSKPEASFLETSWNVIVFQIVSLARQAVSSKLW
jgi:hypothetical protein